MLLIGAPLPALADEPCCAHGGFCMPAVRVGPGAYVSSEDYCHRCAKIQKEYFARKAAEDEARSRKYKEELAQRQAAAAAKAAARVQRENVALGQLAAAEKNLESFDQLRRQQRARRAEVERRFQQQEQAKNNEYQAYLSKLQDAGKSTTPAGTDEEFWNETVAAANYEQVQDPKTRRWGFQTKQGKLVIDYTYDNASAFSRGVAYVREKGVWKLINNRNEVQRTFDKAYFTESSMHIPGLNGISEVVSFSDGLAVVRFDIYPAKNSARMGVLDTKGRIVINPDFVAIQPFRNGTALAEKLTSTDQIQIGKYEGRFDYLDVGLINREAGWVQPPKKKMNYMHHRQWEQGTILVRDAYEYSKLTKAERDEREAQSKQGELEARREEARLRDQMEAEVARRVSAAKSQGMLVENK
ncbi:WG repeat-containing protein [Hymenobacter sp. BT175]|uniref:WG repeat-containing protein n=1 Tax=Hymenobacter translucens TaxID=2886507 RepID=UPI001D0E26A3|nr:WG repeat-containing protein [Hymenobacter translucens]MCC2545537.1 WG repeat-containing protein [Hymenobacter translucens]